MNGNPSRAYGNPPARRENGCLPVRPAAQVSSSAFPQHSGDVDPTGVIAQEVALPQGVERPRLRRGQIPCTAVPDVALRPTDIDDFLKLGVSVADIAKIGGVVQTPLVPLVN